MMMMLKQKIMLIKTIYNSWIFLSLKNTNNRIHGNYFLEKVNQRRKNKIK